MINNNHAQKGFALLMTLIVVSVMVVITASIIELSRKQLALSVTARDSEIAFQAANAGAECVRYIQRIASSSLEVGTVPGAARCFDTDVTFTVDDNPTAISGASSDYLFSTGDGVTWNGDRCSKMEIYVATVDIDDTDETISGLENLFSGYPNLDRVCRSGSACYVAAISGYNQPCGTPIDADTVRREVLLEF